MKMLLAEDDESCAGFIRMSLHDLLEITVVDSMSQVLLLLPEGWDIIWLDLRLKDTGPRETLSRIPHIRREVPKATIVVVSGMGEAYRKESIDAGADGYSGKLELRGFNRQFLGALVIQAAVNAMARGVPSGEVLEQIAGIFNPRCLLSRPSSENS